MIIIHVMGGLGNQLYQYALLEKLRLLGRDVKLDFYAYKDAQGEDRESDMHTYGVFVLHAGKCFNIRRLTAFWKPNLLLQNPRDILIVSLTAPKAIQVYIVH